MAVAKTLLLRLALLIVALVMFGLDANDAFAQSRNCQALANTLQQIERSGDFGDLGDINDRVRAAYRELADAQGWLRVDANAAFDAVAAALRDAVAPLLAG